MNFKAVLLEGVFGDSPKGVCASGKAVADELRPLVGERIRFAMHHLPPNLTHLDISRWGGGSCLWQPAPCPAGHHQDPGWLLNVTEEGTLDDQWDIHRLDGTVFRLPLELMVGHYGRLAAATLFEVEKMRDALTIDDLATVDSLGGKIDSLRELLDRMRQG